MHQGDYTACDLSVLCCASGVERGPELGRSTQHHDTIQPTPQASHGTKKP